MARFVVLEGVDAVSASALARSLHTPLRTVHDAGAAADAVLAAVGGADLVMHVECEREVIDNLCDDLRSLGELDHRIGDVTPAAHSSAPVLSDDERALLAQLIGGASLGEAARVLHLSRRTADRRLASARSALGAASTSEALVLARRLGVRPS